MTTPPVFARVHDMFRRCDHEMAGGGRCRGVAVLAQHVTIASKHPVWACLTCWNTTRLTAVETHAIGEVVTGIPDVLVEQEDEAETEPMSTFAEVSLDDLIKFCLVMRDSRSTLEEHRIYYQALSNILTFQARIAEEGRTINVPHGATIAIGNPKE